MVNSGFNQYPPFPLLAISIHYDWAMNLGAFVALGKAAEDICVSIDSVERIINLNDASSFMHSRGLDRTLVYISTQHHYCRLGF